MKPRATTQRKNPYGENPVATPSAPAPARQARPKRGPPEAAAGPAPTAAAPVEVQTPAEPAPAAAQPVVPTEDPRDAAAAAHIRDPEDLEALRALQRETGVDLWALVALVRHEKSALQEIGLMNGEWLTGRGALLAGKVAKIVARNLVD